MERDTIWFEGVPYTRGQGREYYSPPRGSGKDDLHREIWKSLHGAIPDGHHIHHGDHDPHNNAPENLVCLTPAEHAARHAEQYAAPRREHMARIAPLAAEWHRSAAGLAWHREHARQSWQQREPSAINCDHCGKTAQRFFSRRADVHYCSRRCHRAVADAEQRYTVQVPCPICGALFARNKYRAKPETCGRRCGAQLRRQRMTT